MSLYSSFDANAQLITFNYTTQCTSQILGSSTDSVAAPGHSWIGNRNTGIYRPGTNMIGVVTNGTEAIRVIASGNVGIGAVAIVSPAAALHVAASTAAGTDLVLLNQTNAAGGDIFEAQLTGTTKLIVKNSGNVGVGTNLPQMPLHVYSATLGTTPNMMGVFPMAIMEEQITGNSTLSVAGGTGTVIRQLNTVLVNSLGTPVNLSAYTFTLAAGTYYITAESVAAVAKHRCMLQNTTIPASPITVLSGTSEATTASSICTKSTLAGVITVATSSNFQLWGYYNGAGLFGIDIAQTGVPNVFSRVIIIRYQ